MFGNECLGALKYEATTAAILMAGLFLSFLVEYIGYRVVKRQTKKAAEKMGGSVASAQGLKSLEMVSVYIMEAGIIFHSLSKTIFLIRFLVSCYSPFLLSFSYPPTPNLLPVFFFLSVV
jgi:solute carrier family 39 (zinc transporter), member 1/2/3